MTARSVHSLMINSGGAKLRLSPRFERKLRNWFRNVAPGSARMSPLVGTAFAHCLQRGSVELSSKLLVQGTAEPGKFSAMVLGDETEVSFREVNVDTADWLLEHAAPHIEVRDAARERDSIWVQGEEAPQVTQRLLLSRMLGGSEARWFDLQSGTSFSAQFVAATALASQAFGNQPLHNLRVVGMQALGGRPGVSLVSSLDALASAAAFAIDPAGDTLQLGGKLGVFFAHRTQGPTQYGVELLATLTAFQLFLVMGGSPDRFPIKHAYTIEALLRKITDRGSSEILLDHRRAPSTNIDEFEAAARRMFHPDDLKPIEV